MSFVSVFVQDVAGNLLTAEDLLDSHFKGVHVDLPSLQTAHPTADAGDYASIDSGQGTDVIRALWDADDGWILGSEGGLDHTHLNLAILNATTASFLTTDKDKTDLISGIQINSEDAILVNRIKAATTLRPPTLDSQTTDELETLFVDVTDGHLYFAHGNGGIHRLCNLQSEYGDYGSEDCCLSNNLNASAPPTANDDSADTSGNGDFSVGSTWVDTTADEAYICVDATTASAVWAKTTLSTGELANIALSGLASDLAGTVTLAQMKGLAADRVIGRVGTSGTPQALTATDLWSIIGKPKQYLQIVLTAGDEDISTGVKVGVARVHEAGTITGFVIDCDPDNEPSAATVRVDLNKLNRTTGVATSVLSAVAEITSGNNTGTGTVAAPQAVVAGDLLTFDIDQGSDGKRLAASVEITPA